MNRTRPPGGPSQSSCASSALLERNALPIGGTQPGAPDNPPSNGSSRTSFVAKKWPRRPRTIRAIIRAETQEHPMPVWKQFLLSTYYYGTWPTRWWNAALRAADGQAPVIVLFYHRIADDQVNEWTASNRMFARQVHWLKRHFDMVSLAEAQRRLQSGRNCRPCVSITFDDGYADNCEQALPLLIRENVPCTYFV